MVLGGSKSGPWGGGTNSRTGAGLLQTKLLVKDTGPSSPEGDLVEQAVSRGCGQKQFGRAMGAGREGSLSDTTGWGRRKFISLLSTPPLPQPGTLLPTVVPP